MSVTVNSSQEPRRCVDSNNVFALMDDLELRVEIGLQVDVYYGDPIFFLFLKSSYFIR